MAEDHPRLTDIPATRPVSRVWAARLRFRLCFGIGLVLLLAASISLIIVDPGRETLRAHVAARMVEHQATLLDEALGSAASVARVVALAMTDDALANANLLAEAVDHHPIAVAAILADFSGRTLLMHRREAAAIPTPPQFVEAAPRHSVGGSTLLRGGMQSGQEMLALRAFTRPDADGQRRQVLVMLRSADLLQPGSGATQSWLFATDGAPVAEPSGADLRAVDGILRTWLEASHFEATGQFDVVLADGVHVMLYRRLPGWPLALVVDTGHEVQPALLPGEALALAFGIAALLLFVLGLRPVWAMLHAPDPDPHPADTLGGELQFSQPGGAKLLAGLIAHEVSNLFTVVTFDAEIIGELHADDRAVRQGISSMLAASARGGELTKDLLALAERSLLRQRPVNLAAEIASQYAALSAHLAPGQMLIIRRLSPGTCPALVEIDPDVFSHFLGVLLRHASGMAGAMAEIRLEIDIVSRHGQPHVQVVVDDPGLGLEHADLGERLRDAGRSPLTQKLGLAAVAGFARQSGGQLWIESPTGLGTRACLAFPVCQSAAGEDAVILPFPIVSRPAPHMRLATGLAERRRPVRVLLVDATVPVRESIARRLRAVGFDVIEAQDPSHAEMICARGIDVLLTEMVLNDAIDGWTLATRARKLAPNLPVVFMSGVMSARQLDVMRSDDLASFVRKPIEAEDLRMVIDGLLALRESRLLFDAAD